jgi:putative restriction endonuclease
MAVIQDYLEVRTSGAAEQWRAIQQRIPVPSGRQVDFVPVETLMCLAASLIVNHRRYGGSTSHKAEEPVPTLARLFKRPNSSVLAKMANLDGSRVHGAKHELYVSAQLLADPARLAATYRLVLAAARQVGLGPQRLPDFLELESSDAKLLLLGQEELEQSDLEASVEQVAARWLEKRPDLTEPVTEQLLVAAARVGQHRFACDVLHNHGHHCAFCGLAVKVEGSRALRMLVASHIKPWRLSTPAERLDVRNGIAACPTHDVAFDTGILAVDERLRVHIRPEVREAATTDPATRSSFGSPPLFHSLLLPPEATPPGITYLRWHYANVYLSESGSE